MVSLGPGCNPAFFCLLFLLRLVFCCSEAKNVHKLNAERETPFYAFPERGFCAPKAAIFVSRKGTNMANAAKSNQLANQTKPASDGTFSASQSLGGVAPAGTLYGYARVSARDQNLARQLDALRQFGVPSERIFADKASGKDFERPAWRQLTGALAPGDVLIVKSIDRFGRNYEEIQEEWRRIVKVRGAAVVVLDMPLLDTRQREGDVTSALIADIVLQLLSYVAQVERENIKQRQSEGIAAARARGVRFGRPKKPRPCAYARLRQSCLAGTITRVEAARQLHVSPKTLATWLAEDAAQNASSGNQIHAALNDSV